LTNSNEEETMGRETFEQLKTFPLTKWLSNLKKNYKRLELQLKSALVGLTVKISTGIQ